MRIESDELGGVIYVDHGISAAPSAMVWAAIRPEKIEILRTPPAQTHENCVRGVVKEIAYMGDVSVYLVKIDSGRTMRVTLPNIERLSDDERILWDETRLPDLARQQSHRRHPVSRVRTSTIRRHGPVAGRGRCGRCSSGSGRRAGRSTCCATGPGKRLVIGMPYLWLLVFFLIPFLIVLKISFAEFSPLGRPPFDPILQLGRGGRDPAQAAAGQLQLPAA